MDPARISLLLPTYRRPAELQRTLADVWTSVARPAYLQVLLHVADDDDETMKLFPMLDLPNMTGIRGPSTGYAGLPSAINRLAEMADGDWLFVFADDVGCDTPGWDEVIRRYDHTAPTLLTCENDRGNDFWFPIISRPAYQALGYVTGSQFHDIWLGAIFDRALPGNVHRRIPAHFTDRIVAPLSVHGLPPDQVAEYRRSIDEGVARLAALREVA